MMAAAAAGAMEPATAAEPHAHVHVDLGLGRALPYLPASLMAGAPHLLEELREGASAACGSYSGAALFVDVAGFSALARSLTRSEGGASSCEKLISTLNEYFASLVGALHARGLQVLLFAGDAMVAFIPVKEGRSLADAAALALAAALDVRAIAFERRGFRLTAHTGLGAGEIMAYLIRGGTRSPWAEALVAGDLLAQICDAQRASQGTDIILSEEGYSALVGKCTAEPVAGLSGRPCYRLASSDGLGVPAGAPLGPGLVCACAPRQSAASRALAPFREVILPFVPAVGRGDQGLEYLSNDIRSVVVLFASFPELDVAGSSREEQERHAERLAQVARAVHSVADEFGGGVDKIFLDDKGASAIVAFGQPGFAHENDAERAARAALELRRWFEEAGAPFAAGIAGGTTFCGTLGTPCRKEYALIGDSVILAARLMSAARKAIGAKPGARARNAQEVYCDASVAHAATSTGRDWGGAPFALGAMPPMACKGFEEAVEVYRLEPSSSLASEATGPATTEDSELSSEGHQMHPASLVGRDQDIQSALDEIDVCSRSRQGCTVLVEGPAGYGKTRFLRELQVACEQRGFTILKAAAAATEASTPLYVLRGILSAMLAAQGEDMPAANGEEEEEPPSASASRKSWLPDSDVALLWGSAFDPVGSGSGGAVAGGSRHGPGDARHRSYRAGYAKVNAQHLLRVSGALVRLLQNLERGPMATQRRLAISIEDVHWLDSSSWAAVRAVREALPHLVLLMAARPMEEPPRDFLVLTGRVLTEDGARYRRSSIGEAGGSTHGRGLVHTMILEAAVPRPSIVVVNLEPLTPDDARRLLLNVSQRMCISWPQGAVEAVLEKAAGVPLYLVELCRQQAATHGGRSVASSFNVPDSIQQIVMTHADRLPSQAQAVLKLASVVGTAFTAASILAADPTGMSPGAVHFALRRLRRDKLIAEVPGKPKPADASLAVPSAKDDAESGDPKNPGWPPPDLELGFHHILVKDAIYNGMAHNLRQRVHRRLAEWLVGNGDRDAAALARHWRCAGEFGRSLVYLERAAWNAVRSNALPEARGMFSELCATISAFGFAGPDAPPLPPPIKTAALAFPSARRGSVFAAPDPTSFGRWRESLVLAFGALASIAYYAGQLETSHQLAITALEGMGEQNLKGPTGLLGTARTVLRLARVASRAAEGQRLQAPGKDFPSYARAGPAGVNIDAREAALDCLLFLMWINMKHGKLQARAEKGMPQGYSLAAAAIIRAIEISCSTPHEAKTATDARLLATFSTFLDVVGMSKLARRVLQRASEGGDIVRLAHAGVDNSPEAYVASHAAMQACRHGRFAEGAALFETAFRLPEINPRITLDVGVVLALLHVLRGEFANARRVCVESMPVSSGLGVDERVVLVTALVEATHAMILGKDDRASDVLRGTEVSMDQKHEWWFDTSLKSIEGICAWRVGDAAAAAACFGRAFDVLSTEIDTATWPSFLVFGTLLDFSNWWRSEAAAALAEALGPGGQTSPRDRLLIRRRSRWSVGCGSKPATDDESEGYIAKRLLAGGAGVRSASESPGSAAGMSMRSARGVHLSLDASSSAGIPPSPKTDPGFSWRAPSSRDSEAAAPAVPPGRLSRLCLRNRASRGPSALAAEAKQAHAFARDVAALLEETHKKRLPCLAPLVEAARAERPGVTLSRRLASLRAARDGFAAAGLRPFEAHACVLLARAEPDPAAAAAAVERARALAAEAGLPLPPTDRSSASSIGRTARYVSFWL